MPAGTLAEHLVYLLALYTDSELSCLPCNTLVDLVILWAVRASHTQALCPTASTQAAVRLQRVIKNSPGLGTALWQQAGPEALDWLLTRTSLTEWNQTAVLATFSSFCRPHTVEHLLRSAEGRRFFLGLAIAPSQTREMLKCLKRAFVEKPAALDLAGPVLCEWMKRHLSDGLVPAKPGAYFSVLTLVIRSAQHIPEEVWHLLLLALK